MAGEVIDQPLSRARSLPPQFDNSHFTKSLFKEDHLKPGLKIILQTDYLNPLIENTKSHQYEGGKAKLAGPQSFDPQALLNPKAAAKRHVDGEKKNPDSQANGYSSMIERMHNVQHREHVAHVTKRPKVDKTDEDDKTKGTFNKSISTGTELGQYVKDLRKDTGPASQASSSNDVVDLTEGNEDEDVVYIGNSGDREVCMGRIEGATINASRVPAPKPGSWTRTDTIWPTIQVTLSRRDGLRLQAEDPTGTGFGLLDPKTAHALVPVLNVTITNPIRLSARLLQRQRKDGEFPGAMISVALSLDLTLYAPKSRAIDIARHLSRQSVWLRRPTAIDRKGIEYFNPQDVKASGRGPATEKLIARPGYITRTVEEVRSDVLNMFNAIGRWTNIEEQEPDPSVLTPLLSHQKQGLHFMTEREDDDDDDAEVAGEKSLWKKGYKPNGREFFYHVITGAQLDTRPNPTRGGILADDMGLGKTLTVLSLIVGSKREAAAFAKLSPPRSANREQLMLVRNSKATLLVCPLSVVSNWEEQVANHIEKGALKCYLYHGPTRTRDLKQLASDYDVVITSYGTIRAEYANSKLKTKPIEQINWFRICLDESHTIRDPNTTQSKAICALSGQRRWAITGTPVQNRLDDLGALLKFLHVAGLENTRQFQQHIIAPFKTGDTEILAKLRLLVDHITLRRQKDRLNLPKRVDERLTLDFSPEEEEIYASYARLAKARANAYIQGRISATVAGTDYILVLKLITVLRLLCAHGIDLLNEDDKRLIKGSTSTTAIEVNDDEVEEDPTRPALTYNQAYGVLREMRLNDAYECDRCKKRLGENVDADDDDPRSDVIGHMLPCYSVICPDCSDTFREEVSSHLKNNHIRCPYCLHFTRFVFFELRQSDILADEAARTRAKNNPRRQRMIDEYSGPHTKTKALIEELLNNEKESDEKPEEAPIKSVVFSAWTSHLDLIEIALKNMGFGGKFARLDGSMSLKKRTDALASFRDDNNVTIILISISAGGLGLNLTTANKVYVMEPQFNPAAEAQAIDRVHRLGQKREVRVVRFIMNRSVEERVLKIQEMKVKLADLSMNRNLKLDKEQEKRRKLDELRELFK